MIKDYIKYHLLNQKLYLDIHIVDHCNLNCKCCAHFSSVSKENNININDLESYYKILKPKFNTFFNSIHLLGGEPLLHPQLINILNLTRSYFPNIEIQLVTNGLLLPTINKEFWNTCNTNNITIQITRYPINLDFDLIKELANENNVKCNISKENNIFIHHYLDTEGKQNPIESKKKCKWGGKCIQLKNGKIYPCAQAAHSHILNETFNLNFIDDTNNYLNINELNNLNEFINFINKPIPFCKYCDLNKENYIKWDLSNKSMDEWI